MPRTQVLADTSFADCGNAVAALEDSYLDEILVLVTWDEVTVVLKFDPPLTSAMPDLVRGLMLQGNSHLFSDGEWKLGRGELSKAYDLKPGKRPRR